MITLQDKQSSAGRGNASGSFSPNLVNHCRNSQSNRVGFRSYVWPITVHITEQLTIPRNVNKGLMPFFLNHKQFSPVSIVSEQMQISPEFKVVNIAKRIQKTCWQTAEGQLWHHYMTMYLHISLADHHVILSTIWGTIFVSPQPKKKWKSPK